MASTCVMVRNGCEECASYTRCDGDCGELHHMIAEMIQDDEGHEAWHAAHHCPECGRPKQNPDGSPDEVSKPCRYGNCVEMSCPGCGHERGGVGMALCPCSSRWSTRAYFRLMALREAVRGWVRRL